MEMVQRLRLHKVLIQSLSFSNDEKFLASLGGQDDNTLVIWDVSGYNLTVSGANG
jgi:WD40 repeat protein